MRCPNEDGTGNSCYKAEVLDVLDDPQALPLAAACRKRSRSMNCTNGECQAALDKVLGSKASSRYGSNKFAH